MTDALTSDEIGVDVQDHVAVVEMRRPPHNYFGEAFIAALADTLEALEQRPEVRAIVLCAQGNSFSAGANLVDADGVSKPASPRAINPIYLEALRLFAVTTPIVAAVHGAAVGGGLGLALVADFRVTCVEARFCANFARLGLTPGFGLTATLPSLIGAQKAATLLYTGCRIGGDEAVTIGLADVLTEREAVRGRAIELAREIAMSSKNVVGAVRSALRGGLLAKVREAVARESAQQHAQFRSADFREGVAAMSARRSPVFRDE